MYYPIFLDLRGREVLVVGAGKVALRKVRGLLEAGAVVRVISPRAEPEFDSLAVTMIARTYEPGDVEGAVLVFAATDRREVNADVAREARDRGLLVNLADSAEECDFHVPARARRGKLQVAVSTSGENPKLAAAIRDRVEGILHEFDSGVRT